MLRHQQLQLVLSTFTHVGAGVASGEKFQDILSQVTLVSRPLSKVKPQIKEVGRFEGLFFLERFEQGKRRGVVPISVPRTFWQAPGSPSHEMETDEQHRAQPVHRAKGWSSRDAELVLHAQRRQFIGVNQTNQ